MNIEINNENDLINILDNEQISIFKVKYSNRENQFKNYEALIKSYKIDFFELAIEALSSNQNFWQVGNILTYVIPYSELNIKSIIEFLKKSYELERDTSHHYRITKKLSEVSLETSKQLLELLLKENELYIIPNIPAIQVTLHNKYKISQFDTILSCLKNNDVIKIRSAIGFLHQYDFSENEYQLIFEELKKISKLQNKEIDREIIYKSSDMLEKGYEYFSELLLLYISNNIDLDLRYDISQVLMYQDEKYSKEEWYKKIFMSLAYLEYDTSIANNIEQILIQYLKNKEYDFIEKFIDAWINNSDIYTHEISTFFADFSEDGYFSKFITKALNSENYKMHLLISKNLTTEIKLDKDVLESFDFIDYLYVCRKILGYFYEFNVQMSMIFSILSVEHLPKKIQNLVIEIIVNFIGENYGSNTIEYLNSLNNEVLNKIEKEVKKIVLDKLEERNKKWQELPRLKELMSSSQQNRVIQRTQSLAMSKAMKKSEKDSFILLIATKIPISYGRGWFSELEGNFTEVSYMQSYSHSMVVPTATRTHPIHYELERYNFKLAKKGE
ncbi:hypothetical protein [Sulfurovum sp. NBC37-1]|uniref:hypothetical protein n=1 Tax=Sulfurovum sp. (strain NBC37-1) TaxID=387093 RepID=UPI0001587C7A|nr:hypothetical protein [Sulfurovum sp. NBC37-1]BAF72560.1 hypothetical protein SUN_1610 [Sulfurovum sp. NBC37-1]